MSKLNPFFNTLTALILLCAVIAVSGNVANAASLDLKLSIGAASQTSNEVQIPNTDDGTRFSLEDIAGAGPWPAARIEGIWNFRERHALRVLIAPLSYSETGAITQPIRFAGGTLTTEQPVTGEYRFNSWRVGYRYHLYPRERWDFWIGGTIKVRDAEIKLIQNGISNSDDDLGFVPLLHLAGEYRFSGPWVLAADMDALAGGPGRAIDLGLSLNYQASRSLRIGVEYRTLEGGADTDSVYNFAWFNSALLTAHLKL